MKRWLPLAAFALTLGVGVADPTSSAGTKPNDGTAPPRATPASGNAAATPPAPPALPGTEVPRAAQAPPPPGAPEAPAAAPSKPAPPSKPLPPARARLNQPGAVVATVNGEAITMRQLMDQLVLLGGPQIVDRMIQERILRQEARKHGVVLSEKEIQDRLTQNFNEFRARFNTEPRFQEYLERQRRTPETFRAVMRPGIELTLLQEKLREKITAPATVSEQEIAEFYESQKVLYVEPETARVSHILVAVKSGDMEADKQAKARAEEIVARLKAEAGKKFAEVAKELSDDMETREKGGEMVPLRRPSFYGLTFDQALFTAEPGLLPEPVRSIRGWHVLYLHEKTPSRQKSLEEMTDTIREQLLNRKKAEMYRTHMQAAEKNARTDLKVQF